MKKLISFLCALLLVCFAAAGIAEPYVSNLYAPKTPETLKTLLGGKSFYVRVNGIEVSGEDEDVDLVFPVTFYQQRCIDCGYRRWTRTPLPNVQGPKTGNH